MPVALNDHPVSRRLKTPTSCRQGYRTTLRLPAGHQLPEQNAWTPYARSDD